MLLFSLPNLASTQVKRVEFDDPPEVERPEFKNKPSYRKWCENPDTDHAFVSFCEGLQPSVRVSKSNTPFKLHGLIGEFDAKQDWKALDDRLTKARIKPSYYCKTYSGHMRMFWPFQRPYDAQHTKLTEALITRAWQEIKVSTLGINFIESESEDIHKYFEIGHDWVKVPGSEPISADTVSGWLGHAIKRIDWKRDAVQIPIEAVRNECEKRWPGGWLGGWHTFEVGARGNRFWDNGDANSVIVTEAGCVCFTGDDTFVGWSAILGGDWVRERQTNALGHILEGLWWDDVKNEYWRNLGVKKQKIPTRTDLYLHLTKQGLTSITPKGASHSQVEDAIDAIQRTRFVSGTVGAFYRNEDVVYVQGQPYLNVSQVKSIKPYDGEATPAMFPKLYDFIARAMTPDQLKRVVAWLKQVYEPSTQGQSVRGLALFIVGPPGCGKTFFSTCVVSKLLGGHMDASHYLAGGDQFNSKLLGCPLWTIDDAKMLVDAKTHTVYSQTLKQVIANDYINSRGMHKESETMYWTGRVIVTMNDDPNSIRMLPSQEQSMWDKIMAVKFSHVGDYQFPTDDQVAEELIYFAKWILQQPFPEGLLEPENRFGFKTWHHPELIEAALAENYSENAAEILNEWRQWHFGKGGPGEDQTDWKGTAMQLMKELSNCEPISQIAHAQFRDVNSLGRYVSTLVSEKRHSWLTKMRSAGERLIRVSKL